MSDPRRATLGLLWSLWSEMGIPGVERQHSQTAIDPEPLIAWTPHLAAGDARLRGLAFDWCAHHANRISRTRFPGIAKSIEQLQPAAVEAFARFNDSLQAHGVDWRPRVASGDRAVDRKVVALPLERPALVRFRMRALCGPSIRAEVLCLLLAAGRSKVDAGELTPVGVDRRSVERVLANLITAKLVVATGSDRNRRFWLQKAEALRELADAEQLAWLDWHAVLALAASVLGLWEKRGESAAMRRVEAARVRKKLAGLAEGLRLDAPPGPPEREDLFDALLEWGTGAVTSFAAV